MDDPLSDNVHIIHGFKNHLVEKKIIMREYNVRKWNDYIMKGIGSFNIMFSARLFMIIHIYLALWINYTG